MIFDLGLKLIPFYKYCMAMLVCSFIGEILRQVLLGGDLLYLSFAFVISDIFTSPVYLLLTSLLLHSYLCFCSLCTLFLPLLMELLHSSKDIFNFFIVLGDCDLFIHSLFCLFRSSLSFFFSECLILFFLIFGFFSLLAALRKMLLLMLSM